MFMGFCALVLIALVPFLGGDVRRLSSIRLRMAWIVFVALAVQVLVITLIPPTHHALAAAGHVMTYIGALAVVAVNWRVPGMPVVGAGTFANGFTIAANGGTLPASAAATATAHVHKLGDGLQNSAPLPHPHLAWLGDRFVSPSWLPFRNVVSIGDLLILTGVLVLIWVVSGARLHRAAGAGHQAPAA